MKLSLNPISSPSDTETYKNVYLIYLLIKIMDSENTLQLFETIFMRLKVFSHNAENPKYLNVVGRYFGKVLTKKFLGFFKF